MKIRILFCAVAIILLQQQYYAQSKSVKITGFVYTDNETPLPGAVVNILGTNNSIISSYDGSYSISAKLNQTLVYSFLDYEKQFKVVDQNTVINVTLRESIYLSEVVVVGYGTKKRSDLINSIAKIKGSQISNLITPSFESQLAGRVTGVQVVTPSGTLGESPKVRIRGSSSITSGTNPLYVVDGIPIFSESLSNSRNIDPLADINPNDIESFEILKDGAAAAIYGSRAANGVVLITTKKGKKETFEVNSNTIIGLASPTKRYDLLQTKDFIVINNEKRKQRQIYPLEIAKEEEYDTNWQNVIFNKAAIQIDQNFSLSGGGEKNRYYLSLGYSNQEGIIVGNKMDRYTFRCNLDQDISDKLSVGCIFSYTKNNFSNFDNNKKSNSGIIYNATNQLTNVPIYDEKNSSGYNIDNTFGTIGKWKNVIVPNDNLTNIAYILENNRSASKIDRILSNGFASYKILDGLTYKVLGGIDKFNNSSFSYLNPLHGEGRATNGKLQNNQDDLFRWNIQNSIAFKTSFLQKHFINLLAVTEYQKDQNKLFYAIGKNIVSPIFNENLITDAYSTRDSGGAYVTNGLISYITRLNYDYDKKYYLQFSFRRDGISSLSEDNRWTNFTSLSGGWDMSNEKFMEKISNIVPALKIIGSYSQTGNINIGNNNYQDYYSSAPYASLNGIAYAQFGNNALQWESTKMINIGADASFLTNKIKFTFNFYKNSNQNLVLSAPSPSSLGIPNNNIKKNIGNLYNKGYEIGVSSDILNKSNFKWTIGTNLTIQKNKVTSLPDGSDIIGGSSYDMSAGTNLIIREGESINSLYGYHYYGVNPANGFPVYYKADGSLVQANTKTFVYQVFDPNNPGNAAPALSNLGDEDKKVLGNTLPTYFGGLNSEISFHNFFLNFLVRFSGGNKVFNATRRGLLNNSFNNNSTEILGRWQSTSNPGDGWTPVLIGASDEFTNKTNDATSRFVEDGSYANLENVSLGFQVPTTILEKLKMQTCKIAIQGQNIFMLSKYRGLSPEMETNGVDLYGVPRARIISLSINLKF
jgi:TonB-dependent starch-binding outer membrane protein SusC